MTTETRPFQFANFARSTLLSAVAADAVSLVVQSGDGDVFPVLDATYDEIFSLVVWAEDLSEFEVMYCTAVSGDTLTVERGMEGTTPLAFAAGALVVHTVTAGFFEGQIGAPPTTPVLSGLLTDDDMDLSWTASVAAQGVIDGYRLYRSVDGGAFSLYQSFDDSTLDYTDSNLTGGHTYDYYVVASSTLGPDSDPSNTVEADVPPPPAAEAFMVTESNTGVYSADGETWTEGATVVTTRTHPGVAYHPGLGRWLMCGAAGPGDTVYSDDNGATWTSQNTLSGQNMERAAYAFGYFFIGSNNGSIFRSATGLSSSWTAQAAGARSYDLEYSTAEGRLVSVGNVNGAPGQPVVKYTTDGTSWTDGSTTGLPTDTGGAGDDGALIAVAYDEDRALWWVLNKKGDLYSTSDIVSGTWTARGTTESGQYSGGSISIKSGGGNNEIVVTTGTAGLWVSTDGGDTFTQTNALITFLDGLWSDYIGEFVLIDSSHIYVSTDGVTLTQKKGAGTSNYAGVGKKLV